MKGKRLVWCAAILVVIAAGIGWYYTAGQSVKAEVASAEKGKIVCYIEDTATVKCHRTQTIYSEGTGRIVDLKVEPGDTVKPGDLLALLDTGGLKLQLEDAGAKVSAAQAQLKGTDIVNYANRIEIARASVEQAEIAYESAQRTYENVKQLYDGNTSSKDDLDKAQDAGKAAALTLEAARGELDEIKRGATESVKKGYEAALEQAVIYKDMISDNLKKQEIRAAFDGVVLEKLVEDNSYIIPGTPAFVLGDIRQLELEADILADDAVDLKVGNSVEASGKAVPDGMISGKVIKIAPSAKTVVSALGVNQKRVPVTISLEENIDFLKPGYDLDVKIITKSENAILTVPDTAVFEQDGDSFVFMVENNKAVIRKIIKGIEGKDQTGISEGLREGDKVLVKPDNSIKEGMKITEK